MHKLCSFVASACLVVVVACGSKSATPPQKPSEGSGEAAVADKPAPAPSPEKEAEVRALLTELAKVFEGAGTDCKKLAADVNAFGTANKDRMLAVKTFEDGMTPEQKQAMDKKFETEVGALVKVMEPSMKACGADPEVEAAFKALDV